MRQDAEEIAQKLSEALVDAGKIIDGGFVGFRAIAIPERAADSEVLALRMAFFAGAQHLFSSILAVMDSDREPTARDLHRMSLIYAELETFGKDFELRHLPVDGSA
jgi:hypothetical protein